jgi:hypothetical protein
MKIEYKKKLKNEVERQFNIKVSGLSGLYCYFMMLTSKWLKNNGISVWLVPGEFLDVNYGVEVKKYLLSCVNLKRIHRFKPEDVRFDDALVTSVVVFYSIGSFDKEVVFSLGDDINHPNNEIKIDKININPKDKWSQYFYKKNKKMQIATKFGDLFKVKRGIATGGNKYFILTKEQIEKYNVPYDCYKPILPGPRYLKESIIETDKNGFPTNSGYDYLLDIPYSENEIIKLPLEFQKYLEYVYNEVKDLYLISKRVPWYKQENRIECPLLMTYMGRSGNEPFRLIYNKSKALCTNVYLMIYPKFIWNKIEKENPGFMEKLYEELCKIKSEAFMDEGRVYGGGLLKIEPKELMNTPLDGILSDDVKKLIVSKDSLQGQFGLF